MNKQLKLVLLFLFFIQVSCQENKNKSKPEKMMKYEWIEGTSAPLGYPMEIYKGGIEYGYDGWINLDSGIIPGNGYWGEINNGMSNGFKSLPTHLNFIWMSYMEKQFYKIDTAIDSKKIQEYFNEGYKIKASDGSGYIQHFNYNKIVIGMAPGGVVVVWVAGFGVQKEIGRYQGKKVTIPESEIAKLDSHQNRFWREDYLDIVHTREQIIPKKVQEENKNKPIPFGLWDVYRTRFSWQLVFDLPEGSKINPLDDIGLNMINGEREQLDGAKEPLTDYEARAMPTQVSFTYITLKGEKFEGKCDLKEKSTFEAFKKVFGNDPQSTKAQLVVKVNESNSFFTIKLKGQNGKEVFIKTENLKLI